MSALRVWLQHAWQVRWNPWVVLSTVGVLMLLVMLPSLWRALRRKRPLWSTWQSWSTLVATVVACTSVWLHRRGYDWRFVRDLVRLGQSELLPIVLVVFAVCVWRVRRRPANLSVARTRWVWALLTLGATLAALAVTQPEWGHPIDRLTVIIAEDRSRSMDLTGDVQGLIHTEESRALEAMNEHDRFGRVVFGSEAATQEPVHPRDSLRPDQDVEVTRDATDVGAGIRRALAEIPDESAGRIVLITDGAPNRGDVLGAAAAASAAGVPIDVMRLARRDVENIRVDAVRVPTSADQGETFDLRTVTRATRDADVDVRVMMDGRLAQSGRVHIHAGEDVVSLRQNAPGPGLHRYEVEVSAADPSKDSIVQDNRGGTFLRVRGPAAVLILEGDEGHAEPLAQALQQSAFRTEQRGKAGFPEDLAELASFDLVVLSDVAANALSPRQMDQLATYVRDLGGGLLLMGGDRSMGPGGYSKTPVEEISPVAFDVRQERRRASLAQVIAIDFSGSMSMSVPTGQMKLDLANEAAARSAQLLGAGDQLGVMHVDTEVHWTVPLARIGNTQRLAQIVSTIRAVGPSGGGIIIPVTLTESYAALAKTTANVKHLLLFSDGSDSEEIDGQWSVVAGAYKKGITTSVVSLGKGGDTPELEHLSKEGHGRFYLVEDALRLPAVFARETVLAVGSSINEEPFLPKTAAPDVVTRGIDFAQAPPLLGHVVTIPKPRASILLTGPDNDPILASWQVGVGRVGAFTSDAKDRWGAQWLKWASAPRLWGELARSLIRRSDPQVRVDANTDSGVLHINAEARTLDGRSDSLRRMTARVTGPNGVVREIELDPVGAGTYAAEVPVERSGPYAITLRDEQNGAIVASGGAILLEGEEYRPPSDPLLAERLAAMTGGRVITSMSDVYRNRMGLRRAYTPLSSILTVASMIMMFLALLARRMAFPDVAGWWAKRRIAQAAKVTQTRIAREKVVTEGTLGALLQRKQKTESAEAPRQAPVNPAPPASSVSKPAAEHVDPPPVLPPRTESPKAPVVIARKTPQDPQPPADASGSSSLDALLARKRSKR